MFFGCSIDDIGADLALIGIAFIVNGLMILFIPINRKDLKNMRQKSYFTLFFVSSMWVLCVALIAGKFEFIKLSNMGSFIWTVSIGFSSLIGSIVFYSMIFNEIRFEDKWAGIKE